MASSSPPIRVSPEYREENPAADPSATEVVINLLVVGARLFEGMDGVLRPHGLTTGSFNLLNIVAGAAEPLTPTEIARRSNIKVTTATITGLLDTCQRNGLIRRRPHPGDKRRVLVHLTPGGRALLRHVLPLVNEAERAWVGPLAEGRRETLLRALGEVRASVELALDESP